MKPFSTTSANTTSTFTGTNDQGVKDQGINVQSMNDQSTNDQSMKDQSMKDQSMRDQGDRRGSSSSCFASYSGPIVDIDRVDQCEEHAKSQQQQQQKTEEEESRQWQPLGLDHQAGYSYLYQHSGYEYGENEQQKKWAAQAKEGHLF